jgi:hypothetical protein
MGLAYHRISHEWSSRCEYDGYSILCAGDAVFSSNQACQTAKAAVLAQAMANMKVGTVCMDLDAHQ